MAVPTGTFTRYAAVGAREDLADMIYEVNATDTPFMSNVARGKASAVFKEWQTDDLAAASSSNKVLEGDDATTDTATATNRLGNYCEIADKVARVTGTLNAVNTAGRKNEMSYQVIKRGRELKRKQYCALAA